METEEPKPRTAEEYKSRALENAPQKKSIWKFPELDRSERIELLERLEQGSHWSFSFGVLTVLSTSIASLGLIQGSTGIVIGAMVVAPLMIPLIAAGLGLVQGNLMLFKNSAITMSRGIAAALFIAIFIGFIVPRSDLSGELLARATPNILDLAVAFLAGFAAAYALALPELLGALAGVAIAVALVPPLATSGIAIADGLWDLAQGAGLLFLSNLVAIILGSASVFRLIGIRGSENSLGVAWIRRSFLGLLLVTIMLSTLLGNSLLKQLTWGQSRPSSYPLTNEVVSEIHSFLSEHRNIRFVVGGRKIGAEGETILNLFLSSNRPVEQNFKQRFSAHISAFFGDTPEINVHIFQEVAGSEASIYTAGPGGETESE